MENKLWFIWNFWSYINRTYFNDQLIKPFRRAPLDIRKALGQFDQITCIFMSFVIIWFVILPWDYFSTLIKPKSPPDS